MSDSDRLLPSSLDCSIHEHIVATSSPLQLSNCKDNLAYTRQRNSSNTTSHEHLPVQLHGFWSDPKQAL